MRVLMGKNQALPVFLGVLYIFLALIVPTGVRASEQNPYNLPDYLSFKVMLSAWNSQTGKLEQIHDGRLNIYIAGQIYSITPFKKGGLVSFEVPTGASTVWTFRSGDTDLVTILARIIEGRLVLTKKDQHGRMIAYSQQADGSYDLEYFEDDIYICNQGEPYAPILGKIKYRLTQSDLKPQTTLPSLTRYHSGGTVVGLALIDELLYQVESSGRICVVDVSDPNKPRLVSEYSSPQPAGLTNQLRLGLSGGVVRLDRSTVPFNPGQGQFVTLNSTGQAQLVTVSRAGVVGSWPITGAGLTAKALAYGNGYLYLALGQAGMAVVDIGGAIKSKSNGKGHDKDNGKGHDKCIGEGHTECDEISIPPEEPTEDPPADDPGSGNPPPDDPGGDDPALPPNLDPSGTGSQPDDFGGDPTDVALNPLPPTTITSEWFNQAINGAVQSGASYSDNRVLAYSQGSDPLPGDGQPAIDQTLGGLPLLVFQWVYAGTRDPLTLVLQLGEKGEFGEGLSLETLTSKNSSGVPMITFLRTFPPEFLIGLARGAHSLRYWLEDPEGNKSNIREESILIEPAQ